MSKNKNKVGRPKKAVEVEPLHIEIDVALASALRDYMNSLDIPGSRTAHITVALKEYLTKRGAWPERKE